MTRRRHYKQQSLNTLSEINLTPLIDLAFSLLIIFMITTPLLEHNIDLELPTQSQSTSEPAPEQMHTLSIDPNNQYYWDEQIISLEALKEQLLSLKVSDKQPSIHVRAHAALPYQSIVTVLDLIQSQGLSKVNLDTRSP